MILLKQVHGPPAVPARIAMMSSHLTDYALRHHDGIGARTI